MEIDYKSRYERALEELRSVREDNGILKAQVAGDVVSIASRLQGKVQRQRAALRILDRRVRVQRLHLRKLNEMERGLRPEEWTALKAEYAHELADDEWDV